MIDRTEKTGLSACEVGGHMDRAMDVSSQILKHPHVPECACRYARRHAFVHVRLCIHKLFDNATTNTYTPNSKQMCTLYICVQTQS